MTKTGKEMFTTNPSTGQVERKNDKMSWNELMNSLVNLPQATKAEYPSTRAFNRTNAKSGLSSIVVWPGGKTKELKHIYANLPSYDRFFEPFVGGGSVFMGINAQEYYINDFSTSLISLYKNISSSNAQFFHYVEAIDMSIESAKIFAEKYQNELADIYEQFRSDILNKEEMKSIINGWCITHQKEILDIIGEFASFPCNLIKRLNDYLSGGQGKFMDLKRKGCNDIYWIYKHLEAAIKGAVYNNYRDLYNNKDIEDSNVALHSALMVYIHQFVRDGSFKYDKAGNFNASCGGIQLLNKRLNKKLEYLQSNDVCEHFNKAHIYNYDFEDFLLKTTPTENDFIFLDPPYDETFSKYDSNDFNRDDHRRLASYLLNTCKAKWMMIIKKTDFIYNLYNHPGIVIQEYEHSYSCNAKYNDGPTIHLLITNYDPAAEGQCDMSTTTPAITIKEKKQELPILAEKSNKNKSNTFVAQKENKLNLKNKSVMKIFNPIEFNNIVKNYCTSLNITSDAQAMFDIAHLSKANGYDCADVIPYIYNLWLKVYPAFVSRYNSKDWVKIYEHYIKEAEEKCDWEYAHQLKEILINEKDLNLRGEAKQNELRTQFFNLVSKNGLDPKLMEMDMTIDCWGWIKTISLIAHLAKKGDAGCIDVPAIAECKEVIVPATSLEEVNMSVTITPESDEDKGTIEPPSVPEVVATKIKQTRKRDKYLEIQQFSKEGELINTFKNIAEASKSGNFNHASISKCVSGKYKMAEGYKWVGVKEQNSDMANAA